MIAAKGQNYGSISNYPKSADAKKKGPLSSLCLCGNCLVAVPQDRWYVVESFGKFEKVLGPGLSWIGLDLCGCCFEFRSISSRVEQNICVVETKTKDNVFVTVHVAIQQSVIPEHVEEAIYKLSSVDSQIDSYVADVVRSQVPKMMLDEAFDNKDAISDAVMRELAVNMKDYGFVIHKALVTELTPSPEVASAMNEITRQSRLRDAEVMRAEAEKIKVVKAAEAAAESARLQGEGIANQRSAIVNGLRSSITAGTDEVLTSDKISELLLMTQYFETLRDIGANSESSAIFIPQSPAAGIADIAGQLRSGILQAGIAQGAPLQAHM